MMDPDGPISSSCQSNSQHIRQHLSDQYFNPMGVGIDSALCSAQVKERERHPKLSDLGVCVGVCLCVVLIYMSDFVLCRKYEQFNVSALLRCLLQRRKEKLAHKTEY